MCFLCCIVGHPPSLGVAGLFEFFCCISLTSFHSYSLPLFVLEWIPLIFRSWGLDASIWVVSMFVRTADFFCFHSFRSFLYLYGVRLRISLLCSTWFFSALYFRLRKVFSFLALWFLFCRDCFELFLYYLPLLLLKLALSLCIYMISS